MVSRSTAGTLFIYHLYFKIENQLKEMVGEDSKSAKRDDLGNKLRANAYFTTIFS